MPNPFLLSALLYFWIDFLCEERLGAEKLPLRDLWTGC